MARLLTILWLFAALMPAWARAQERIENSATLRYVDRGGTAREVASNTVTLTLAAPRRTSRIELRALPPGVDGKAMHCVGGTGRAAPLTADQLAAAPPRASIDPTVGTVVVVTAPGGDRSTAERDTITVTLAAEAGGAITTMTLTETAPDSGVFAGGWPARGVADTAPADACRPALIRGDRVEIAYAGDAGNLPASLIALVDPAGVVFDASDGTPVDGAEVTLLDEGGRPATVVGDDGHSVYPATVVSGTAVHDAGGQLYPVARGGYRFPRVATGRYRLRVVAPPGYAAPSQASPAALAALRDAAGRPFVVEAASTGGALEVTGSDPVMTDIPLDHADTGGLVLTIEASQREASAGDLVEFRVRLSPRGRAASGPVHVRIAPPPGLRYRDGSLRGAVAVTRGSDGALDVTLAAIDSGGTAAFRYLASVTPAAPVGPLTTTARAASPFAASNTASATIRVRALLFTDALTVIGRVSAGGCAVPDRRRRGVAGARILLDDGTSAITDDDGLYHLAGVRAGRHVVALDPASVAGFEPVDCAADTRSAGSATSRFVEAAGGLVRRVDFQLAGSGRPVAAPPPAAASATAAAAAGDRDWLAGRRPGIAWLYPEPATNPRAPVTRVAIAHAPGQRVALTIDGHPVDPMSFDATDADAAAGVAVSRWVGIPLRPGANRLAARVLAADGGVVDTLTRIVTVSGPPHGATLDPARGRLIADGLSPPLVAVRVVDADGRPVRDGTPVRYAVAAPLAAAGDPAREASAPVIGDDGIALLPLRPTAAGGMAHLTLMLEEGRGARPITIDAPLTPAARGWTVVGFAAGTIGRDTLARHAQPLPLARRGRRFVDGEVSLYAKGRVRGRWLVTLAYDSGRVRDPARGIGGLIDPDRYYTVYGDASAQGADAATQGKLYLRLETRRFQALFGDADTGLADTRLARYARPVEGWHAEYRGSGWQAIGFAARPDTVAGRDEIQGVGLSGPYRLRAQHLVPGSDRVRIEVRDRLRSELILSSTPMARHIDYDIDPVAGTLRFAAPVLSRDATGAPIFIVTEYEVEAGAAAGVAGGRLARRIGRATVGTTLVDDRTLGRGRLAGVDGSVALGTATVLRGEVAAGGWRGLGSGTAFLAEAEHRGARLDASLYVRQQPLGFGLGQQNLAEAGSRKTGIDLAWRPADGLSLTAAGWVQRLLASAGTRVAGEARIDWTRGARTVFAGARVADDTGTGGGDRRSRLLTLGVRQAAAGGALVVEGRTDLAPGGVAESVDFPARRQLTAAWQLSPSLRLLGGWEWASGKSFTTRTLRGGIEVAPWSGGTATVALGGQGAEGGQGVMGGRGVPSSQGTGTDPGSGGRRFAQYGLHQSLPLGREWSIDGTLDSTRTLSGALPAGAEISPFQPTAAAGTVGVDAGDFTAATLGLGYRGPRWSGRGRLEWRSGAVDRRLGLTLDLARLLGDGRTLAAGWRSYQVRQASGGEASSVVADIAFAWRPPAGGWGWLDRFSLRRDTGDPQASAAAGTTLGLLADGGGGAQATTRLVDNLAVTWRSRADGRGRGMEASLSYGIKYVRGRYDDEVAAGLIDATGIEVRRSLGHRIDIGVAASVEHGWSDRVWAWSGGPSLGVSPAGDLWFSMGYNFAGYRERDLGGDRTTRGGPYLTLRTKFDARRLAGWLGRRS